MQPHWKAWLSIHTDRTREWLEERIADGFEVHHIDCDHFNNDPSNLVLIEATDHHWLHGKEIIKHLALPIPAQWAKYVYELREKHGFNWRTVGENIGISGYRAEKLARHHAIKNKLKWPLPCTMVIKSEHKRPIHPDAHL